MVADVKKRIREVLMLSPSRTLLCTGDLHENVQIIIDAFAADGFKLSSTPGEFPVRMKSGSAFLDTISENEFLILLRANKWFRKQALPLAVLIHYLGHSEEAAEIRVEMTARAGSAGHFTPNRFESLLGAALDQLRAQDRLRHLGDLSDSAARKES